MNQYLEIILMFVKAFLVGGAICLIAQVIINFTKLTAGKILVYFMLAAWFCRRSGCISISWISRARARPSPISGFGYLLANGAIRGAQKGLFYAVTGSLAAASAGVTAAVVFAFIFALIFKSHSKKN